MMTLVFLLKFWMVLLWVSCRTFLLFKWQQVGSGLQHTLLVVLELDWSPRYGQAKSWEIQVSFYLA